MWLIYITPLFLYFPRIVPGVETQPLLAVVAAAAGLAADRNRRAALAFVTLAVLLLLWIVARIGFGDSPANAVGLIQILVGPLILFGVIGLQPCPPSRNILAGVTTYFGVAAALEFVFPSVYGMLAAGLLTRFSVTDGHRGVSLFTPEPTYAAITIIYFLLLARWSRMQWGIRHRWIEPALVLCLLATGSTYVGLMLLALALVRWPRITLLASVAAIASVALVGVVALDNEDSIRAVVAVSRILASDFTEFLPSISVIDASLGSRLVTNVASFMTPLHSPLGLGLDCSAVSTAFDAAGFDFAYNNTVLQEVMYDGCLKPQSYLAAISLGLGLASVVFLMLLLGLLRFARHRHRGPMWRAPAAVAAVILTVQGQLTNPIPWFLIAIAISAGSNSVPKLRLNIIRNDLSRLTK